MRTSDLIEALSERLEPVSNRALYWRLGAWVGGLVISHGMGFDAIPPTAAALALGALLLTFLSWLTQNKRIPINAKPV